MRYKNLPASWLLRGLLVVILVPHAIGKVVFSDTFEAKFGLSSLVTYLTATAEFAAALGMILGGVLLVYNRYRDAWIITALSLVATWIVQVGAIAMVHWPVWLYYMGDHGGMEFNVTLLAVTVAVLLLTPLRQPESLDN